MDVNVRLTESLENKLQSAQRATERLVMGNNSKRQETTSMDDKITPKFKASYIYNIGAKMETGRPCG